MPLVAPLVVSVALATLTASPAAQLAPHLAQLPQGTKIVTLRCTPAPPPAPAVDKNAPRPPSRPTGSSQAQVGTIAPQTGSAEEVIDLGPCPQEPAADEPESTTTPTGGPADDQGVDDAERARHEAMRRAQQLIDAMNRTRGGVIDGATR
jgi:hypothetical protein